MATRIECDRCKKIISGRRLRLCTNAAGIELTFDLCSECEEAFRAFMKNDSVSSTVRTAEAKK